MRKLNILIILHWVKPDGSGIYYYRLAKALKNRGHNVIVASTGGHLAKELKDNGIRHYKFNVLNLKYYPPINYYLWYIPSLFNMLKGVIRTMLFYPLWLLSLIRLLILIKKEKIDVLDSHSIGAIILSFACTKITGTPFLVRVSAPVFVGLPPSMFRRIYPIVGKIIVVSQECANYITGNCKWRDEKIIIIHNSVDTNQIRPFSEDEMRSYKQELDKEGLGIDHNKKKIVIVSRLDEDKEDSVISTIKAAPIILREIPNTQIIVVGDGNIFDKIYRLAEEVNRRQKEKIVIMMGYRSDVEKIMNLADVTIGVGGTAVEAMACGKPVIVAGHRTGQRGGSFGGIVTENNIDEFRNYYFTGRHSKEETTPERVAESCIKVLRDEGRMKQLGEFGRRFVMEECNLEKNVTLIEELYFDASKVKS